MPEPLTTYINNWRTTYQHISADIYNFRNYLEDAAVQCEAHNWEGLALSFRNMRVQMEKVQKHFFGGSPNLRTTTYAAMDWIDDNWPDGDGEVTMDAILSAMITADIGQLEYFVGLVDAYRMALWNQPFNAEFYAALARGFML